jgi:hypothetical protein
MTPDLVSKDADNVIKSETLFQSNLMVLPPRIRVQRPDRFYEVNNLSGINGT